MSAGEADLRQILRDILELEPDQPVDIDAEFTASGIESIQIVEFMVAVEQVIGLEIPDDLLTVETVRSPRTIWNAACIALRVADETPESDRS